MNANSYQVDTSPVSYQIGITPYHKIFIKSDLYRASYQKWGNTAPEMGEMGPTSAPLGAGWEAAVAHRQKSLHKQDAHVCFCLGCVCWV